MSDFLKRALDILLASIGTLLLLPVFPLIAILIKLDSKGPVLYLCNRIGKNGKLFKMYKFRTMLEIPAKVGTSVSPQGDVRVTDFGRILRRTKLNELPQLINILKGDMSFVGPRPEAPDLAELYPEDAKILFSVKPGLVGPARSSTEMRKNSILKARILRIITSNISFPINLKPISSMSVGRLFLTI